MEEKNRVEMIMKKEELTAVQFATEIGIQGSTLSHIINGRNNPSLDVLKKILNRFRTISSDWLILGVGSMYRSEKQSQPLTLFDSMEENETRSSVYTPNTVEKRDTAFSTIQQNKMVVSDVPVQQVPEAHQNPVPMLETVTKTVRKIIIYYTDNTFQEFKT